MDSTKNESNTEKVVKSRVLSIPGTKPNVQNAQLLISTGIPSLDLLIGGGLAVGTVMLIEDDAYGCYGDVFLKYFLAEGVASKQTLYVASKDIRTTKLVSELPALINDEDIENETKDKNKDIKMSIAWRYQHLSTTEQKKLTFSHYYDLSKTMDQSFLKDTVIHHWDNEKLINNTPPNTFSNPIYHELLQDIKNVLKKFEFETNAKPEKRTILRVALHSLGSPFWIPIPPPNETIRPISRNRDLDMFMFCLKALMRSAYAVAVITVPTGMITEDCMARCVHNVDTAIRLETFMGTPNEKNPALSDYNGFLNLTKLPSINTVEQIQPASLDLAFKLRRKKFVIEKLHLPPELAESRQREQDDSTPSFGCGSFSKQSKLDF
ncbi:putative elongator complex protein 4 [Chrysoperla carnea]|uniref:putative elongator complex protein 4 n=1 Tax=Chrysoperla carnea TaxID=189513 RepID=UPI001D06B850|nr:putative elongator complex protein 4 [Chrysoperla carnea]